MEIRFNMRCSLLCSILLPCLPLILCGHTTDCYAQRRAHDVAAHKFDEYKLGLGDGLEESKRLARFANQLKREPLTKAYVIAYGPRVLDYSGSSYWHIAKNRLLTTRAELTGHYGIKESRIITVDGGIREDATVEFWILPVGATPPKPRPEYQSGDVVTCYPVRVEADLYALRRDMPLKFSAVFRLGNSDEPVTFQWAVSSGKIISGQGTNSITVDVNDVNIRSVTATVEVKGLPAECNEKGSDTTVVGVVPYKLFEFEERYSEDLQARLDYLAVILGKEPLLQGHIIVYGGWVGSRNYVSKRSEAARSYLTNLRGLSPQRITFVKGGYREHQTFEIWLVPRGVPTPPATPAVNEKYVRFTDQSKTFRKRNRR